MISVEEYEGSADFQALKVAAEGKPRRQMGDAVIAAEPPQWGVVNNTARSLLAKAPAHLAPLVLLIKAEANLNGFVGMNGALKQAKATLAESWDEMYPEADPDDPEDLYYARINLLREIADEPAFIENLYRVPVVSVKGIGEYSCRDIDICRGATAGNDEDKDRCQDGLIRGAFKKTDASQLQATADALQEVTATCQELEALFLDKAGSYNALSLDTLIKKISGCHSAFIEYAQDYINSTEKNQEPAVQSTTEADTVEVHQPSATGLLKSRQAAFHALDRIIEYYCAAEPSSPVGVLAQRAKDMVTKPFFAVLQELAPTKTDSFGMVLSSLSDNPTAFLLDDSYKRFLAGEQFPSPPNFIEPVQDSQDEPAAVEAVPGAELSDNSQLNGAAIVGVASSETSPVNEPHPIGQIASRHDVIAVLGELEQYFNEQEPSNPIPLVLADMRKMVPKRFTELLADFSNGLPERKEAAAAEAKE